FGKQTVALGIEASASFLFDLASPGPAQRAPYASGQDQTSQSQRHVAWPDGLMRKSTECESNHLPGWQPWPLPDNERLALQRHVSMFGNLRRLKLHVADLLCHDAHLTERDR